MCSPFDFCSQCKCQSSWVLPGFPCEREQHLSFDGSCVNGNQCCCRFPVNWPPQLTNEFAPKIICRDCCCEFQQVRRNPCLPPPVPDFSELLRYGYRLEIDQPNRCNEIYFNYAPYRCIPPRVFCNCPLCRRRRRYGDHFKDCTCDLCNEYKAKCANRIRRQLLAEHQLTCGCCGRKHAGLPCCCVPLPTGENCGKEMEKSEGPHPRCPCHQYVIKSWVRIKACPDYEIYAKAQAKEEAKAQKAARDAKKKCDKIWKWTTLSLSQTIWLPGRPKYPPEEVCGQDQPVLPCCPEHALFPHAQDPCCVEDEDRPEDPWGRDEDFDPGCLKTCAKSMKKMASAMSAAASKSMESIKKAGSAISVAATKSAECLKRSVESFKKLFKPKNAEDDSGKKDKKEDDKKAKKKE